MIIDGISPKLLQQGLKDDDNSPAGQRYTTFYSRVFEVATFYYPDVEFLSVDQLNDAKTVARIEQGYTLAEEYAYLTAKSKAAVARGVGQFR